MRRSLLAASIDHGTPESRFGRLRRCGQKNAKESGRGRGASTRSPLRRIAIQQSLFLLAYAALSGCGGSGASDGKAPSEARASSDMPANSTPANVAVTAKGIPRRADGWWEITRVNADGSRAVEQFFCVGDGSEDRMTVYDQVVPFSDCSKNDFKRTASGWSFDAKCGEVGVDVASKGTISGDFQNSFRVDLRVDQSNSPPQIGSLIGKRVGACPAGVKGGAIANSKGRVIG